MTAALGMATALGPRSDSPDRGGGAAHPVAGGQRPRPSPDIRSTGPAARLAQPADRPRPVASPPERSVDGGSWSSASRTRPTAGGSGRGPTARCSRPPFPAGGRSGRRPAVPLPAPLRSGRTRRGPPGAGALPPGRRCVPRRGVAPLVSVCRLGRPGGAVARPGGGRGGWIGSSIDGVAPGPPTVASATGLPGAAARAARRLSGPGLPYRVPRRPCDTGCAVCGRSRGRQRSRRCPNPPVSTRIYPQSQGS